MSSTQIEIQLIAVLTSVACAIPGVFLVLRRMSLISDAISHSILLGIVIGFFITQDISSPFILLMAGAVGVLTVLLVEGIQKTQLVKEDTAIGLVFPALFSIGVILIAQFANDIHLDVDAVLLGELAFAPFDRWYWNDLDMGPQSMWTMGVILLISTSLLILFYKELKVSTFDPQLSITLGISPWIIHYALMTTSSITIVGAFDAVGAILVVALMIVPAASAYLLTHRLLYMILLAILFGTIASIAGYWLAYFLNASIAGSMATVLGIIFFIVYLFAPQKGWISHLIKSLKQRQEVMLLSFLLHLHNLKISEHEKKKKSYLQTHFDWNTKDAQLILNLATQNELVYLQDEYIHLTDKGREFSQIAIEFITTNHQDKIELLKKDFLIFRT